MAAPARTHQILASGQRVVDGPGRRRCTITRNVSTDQKLLSATVAYAVEVSAKTRGGLENASSAITVPTDLTEMVLRLRDLWIALPASLDVAAVCERAVSDVDKRVAVLLRDGFFEFSQFLCGLEILALQLQEHGVVSEQTLLGCQQLLVDLRDSRSRLIEVANGQGGGGQLLGALEQGNRRGD